MRERDVGKNATSPAPSLAGVYPVFGARVFANEMSSALLGAEDTRATGNRVRHLAASLD